MFTFSLSVRLLVYDRKLVFLRLQNKVGATRFPLSVVSSGCDEDSLRMQEKKNERKKIGLQIVQ